MIQPVPSNLVHEHGAFFFDSGSLARVPKAVKDSYTGLLPLGWDALIAQARHRAGRLLAPEKGVSYAFEPDTHVVLFNNTTSAFTRVLSRIEKAYAGSDPTLLTTDLEYPGCVAAIDDVWSGPVVMASVSRPVIKSTNPDSLLSETLIRAHNFVKPRVVVVSHVMRTTGQALLASTLRNLRELNPRVIVVIDGSQAVGNVVVSEEFLREVDFYIASGHKWLGGETTSGFVWLRDPDRWKDIADPAQALTYQSQLGGSGHSTAWASLIVSVDDMVRESPRSRLEQISRHNRALGKVFVESLASVKSKIEVVTPLRGGRPPSGLVTLGVRQSVGDRVVKELNDAGFAFTVLDSESVRWRSAQSNRFVLERDNGYPVITPTMDETPTSPRKARVDLRFCFHYWHGEDDVRALAGAIVRSLGG